MKKSFVAFFGFTVLFGNVCLMNVSYAAGTFPSDERGHMSHGHAGVQAAGHCAENMCMESGTGETEKDAGGDTCAAGHCMRAGNGNKDASPSAAFDVTDSGSHGFIDALITQALLIAGPNPVVEPFAEGQLLKGILTVVMRK
ncbi:MAG: hypothetical protein AAB728_01340 [Patescibacteria group bacterium]